MKNKWQADNNEDINKKMGHWSDMNKKMVIDPRRMMAILLQQTKQTNKKMHSIKGVQMMVSTAEHKTTTQMNNKRCTRRSNRHAQQQCNTTEISRMLNNNTNKPNKTVGKDKMHKTVQQIRDTNKEKDALPTITRVRNERRPKTKEQCEWWHPQPNTNDEQDKMHCLQHQECAMKRNKNKKPNKTVGNNDVMQRVIDALDDKNDNQCNPQENKRKHNMTVPFKEWELRWEVWKTPLLMTELVHTGTLIQIVKTACRQRLVTYQPLVCHLTATITHCFKGIGNC